MKRPPYGSEGWWKYLSDLRMAKRSREDVEAAHRCGPVIIVQPAVRKPTRRSWHGSLTGYVNHKCRCEKCREAARLYYQAREAAKKLVKAALNGHAAEVGVRGDSLARAAESGQPAPSPRVAPRIDREEDWNNDSEAVDASAGAEEA